MNINPSPYSTPSPIEMLDSLAPYMRKKPSAAHYQAAEILACFYTIDAAILEGSGNSTYHQSSAESWRELAGAVVDALPTLSIRTSTHPTPFDPFAMDKREFRNGESLRKLKISVNSVLSIMVAAARKALPYDQKFTDNYHAVICLQLCNLGLLDRKCCEEFCRTCVSLPVPRIRSGLGLVYPPDFDVSEPMPTDYEAWEHDDWKCPVLTRLRDLI